MLNGLVSILLIANIAAMAVHWIILRSRFSEKKILADLREEVDRLVTDLGREADRDVELLEGRIRLLRELIAETDSRILLGRREAEKRERAVRVENTLSVPVPPVAPRDNNPAPPLQPEKRNEPIMVYTKPMITRSERPIEPLIPMHEKVLDMARKGISAEMIASTLALSQGEVELIIDMNSSSL